MLLSVVDGILDAIGKAVRTVESLDQVQQLVRAEKSRTGKGGMNSKIEAARTVTSAGEAMVVADGRMENILTRISRGEEIGTLFVPAAEKIEPEPMDRFGDDLPGKSWWMTGRRRRWSRKIRVFCRRGL